MFLIIIFVIVLLIIGVISLWLTLYALHIKRQSYEEALKFQRKYYDISFYEDLEKDEYKIEGYEGYVLRVWLLYNPVPSDRYIIITHGHTDNHIGMLKYAKMYIEFGFNVIIYDIRAHGENADTICTFSIKEAKDLDILIKDTKKRYRDISVLGIHGESLGAATTIAVLRYKPEIDFAVADCPFAEITGVFKGVLKQMHLPAMLIYPASMWAKLIYGYSFSQMRPVDGLRDNEIPVLFIHGEDDGYIVPSNSKELKDATKGYSELHLIPGADHAASMLTAPDEYRRIVRKFLTKLSDKYIPGVED
ncbi:MAG: alpha/beta hydrolase [Lachnospiraceae bacterium]|nr:alpha/beta hydrolase [Lachnospiraceae bacterium]